jgi:nicotinamidase-related amidase
MSTLTDRPNTALIVIDVQNAVVEEAHDRDRIVGNIAALVSKARAAGVPVIWVQHNDEELVRGTGEWEYVPELKMVAGEPVVHKSYNDSFEDTNLETHLGGLGVGHLVIAGAQTEWCVRSTLHGAIARGYDALLVSDAHTTGDMSEEIPATSIIKMTNTYWKWHSAPGRTAGIMTTAEVSFVG